MFVTVTGFLLVYFFWFLYPGLKTSYNLEIGNLNMTSPTMVVLKPIADSWFMFLPILIAFIGGYSIWLYFTRREAADY